MVLHKKLIRVILVYIAIFLLANLLFGIVYFVIANVCEAENTNLGTWIYFSMMNFATISHGDITPIPEMRVFITIHYLCASIVVPIISGLIFYYILNRPPKIIFPEKLIIRRRTSEGNQGQVTLGLQIGNRNKFPIYDVKCKLIYVYYKTRFDGVTARNAETNFTEYVHFVQNYYRFSFSVLDFPKPFVQSIIEPTKLNLNDGLMIIVQGKYGDYGDDFLITKNYSISDLIIAKDTEMINIAYELLPSLRSVAARSRVVSRNFFGQRARSAASGFALGLYFLASANIVYTPSLANAAGGA
jgi:hypothetical protein